MQKQWTIMRTAPTNQGLSKSDPFNREIDCRRLPGLIFGARKSRNRYICHNEV